MVPPVSMLLEGDDRTWRPDKPGDDNALITCLSNHDLFTLYVAAIGHDVGHPGFTNGFMVSPSCFNVSRCCIHETQLAL